MEKSLGVLCFGLGFSFGFVYFFLLFDDGEGSLNENIP